MASIVRDRSRGAGNGPYSASAQVARAFALMDTPQDVSEDAARAAGTPPRVSSGVTGLATYGSLIQRENGRSSVEK